MRMLVLNKHMHKRLHGKAAILTKLSIAARVSRINVTANACLSEIAVVSTHPLTQPFPSGTNACWRRSCSCRRFIFFARPDKGHNDYLRLAPQSSTIIWFCEARTKKTTWPACL